MKKKIIKTLLVLAGLALVFNALLMSVLSNINAGIIAELLLGTVILFYGVLLENLVPKIPKFVRCTFVCSVGVVAVFITLILGCGVTDTVTGDESAVIVLGSGIRGELLTVGLKNRLDCAVEMYEENHDMVIVVSGGQGPQEDITEALAMERYLLSRSVPQENIIKEEQATSTYENFVFSKQILDEMFGGEYKTAYVTNDYHIYRAGALAKIAGFDEITHSHSTTVWYTVIPSCMRECMAVVKLWMFKK